MRLFVTNTGDYVDCDGETGKLSSVNKIIGDGNAVTLVAIAESLHERKYGDVAEAVNNRHGVKLVLIAGPSSSGKTTTSNRVAIQCRVSGLNPIVLGMDNYFVDRELTPKDENGKFDFECPGAVNMELLASQMNALFAGEEVELRRYDFISGKNISSGRKVRMSEKDIIIMEGIHALNPMVTSLMDDSHLFKVYASTMTSLEDDFLTVRPEDFRLLRRILRDHRTRGVSALNTIERWTDVMSGENKYIAPFKGEADISFDTSLVYELSVLKCYLEPLLHSLEHNDEIHSEVERLLTLLSHVRSVMPDVISTIPASSILREFIGGSLFEY